MERKRQGASQKCLKTERTAASRVHVANDRPCGKNMELIQNSINKDSIAFDIDGVLVNTMELILHLVHEKTGRDYSLREFTEYDVSECLDIDRETAYSIYMDIMSDEYNDRLTLIDGAKDVLQKLAAVTDTILLVTARHHLGNFKAWLCAALEIPEDKVEMIGTGSFEAKLDVLRSHGKTVMVEDRLETCLILAEGGITPLVFVQPWNRKPHAFMDVDWAAIDHLLDY